MEDYKKRLDEVLASVKQLAENNPSDEGIQNWVQDNFPELKESEDEKIRESLLEYLHTLPNHYTHSGVCVLEWIAWLEKQGEKESVTCPICGWEIEKQGEQRPYGQRTECFDCQFNYAGECKGHCSMKQGEQKPAWSEEDERRYRGLHNLIYSTPYCDSRKELSDWLKSLKDRVQPQPKQEWSEEDETYSDHIITAIKSYYTDDKGKENPWREELLRWFKSLKDRYTWKPSDEQMNAFDAVLVSNPPFSNECRNHLITLYNDLKKLREE